MAEFDYKEYARQMRKYAARDKYGNIICSSELWEQIATIIESIPAPKEGGENKMQNSQLLEVLREKCIEKQEFLIGEDNKYKGYVSIEDLDVIIDELQNIQ